MNELHVNDGIEIYFELLKDCVKTYNKLITISCIKNPLELKKCYFNIIQSLNKIIPWNYDSEMKIISLATKDGVLCYKDIFEFLEDDMNNVLDNYYSLIDNVRNIRNGIEHAPHQIEIFEMSSGNNISFIEFIRFRGTKKEKHIVKSADIEKLLIDLNKIYSQILRTIMENQDTFFLNKGTYTFKYLKGYKFEEIYHNGNNRIYKKNSLKKLTGE